MENIEKKIRKPEPPWVEKAYRILAGKYGKHPKHGGDEEILKDINVERQNGEYSKLLKRIKKYKDELVNEENEKAALAAKESQSVEVNGVDRKAMVTPPDYFTFDEEIKKRANAIFEGVSAMSSKIDNGLKMSKPGIDYPQEGSPASNQGVEGEDVAPTPDAVLYKDKDTRTKQVYNGFGLSEEMKRKLERVESGLKTVNIGKEEEIKMIRKNKGPSEGESVKTGKDTAKEIDLESLRTIIEDVKKSTHNDIRVVDFSPSKPFPQEESFTVSDVGPFENDIMDRHIQRKEAEADRRLSELIEEGKKLRERLSDAKKAPAYTMPEVEMGTGSMRNVTEPESVIRVPLSRPVERPVVNDSKVVKDINPTTREEKKAFTGDIGSIRVERVPVNNSKTVIPTEKGSVAFREKVPGPTTTSSQVKEKVDEVVREKPPTPIDASPQETIKGPEVDLKGKTPEKEIPFIDNVSDVKEKDDKKEEEVFTMFKDLAERELSMDSLRRKIVKGVEIAKRLDVKKVVVTEAENEYRKVKKEYDAIKERLKGVFKGEESSLEEEIRTRKFKLGEMESRFSQEKAKEYLSHSKKILEYQKESLSGKKAELMDKMGALARNRKLQAVLGLILIGVSVDLPEIAGLIFTSGMPENVTPVIQTIGGVAGGYLAGGLSRAKKAFKEGDGFDEDMEIETPFPGNGQAPRGRTVSFEYREPLARDNFFRYRLDVEES
jgi:hypothetical protein